MRTISNIEVIFHFLCIVTLRPWPQADHFTVSYVITFAFYFDLNLEKVIVRITFGYSLEKLVNVGYFTRDMLVHVDMVAAKKWKDYDVSMSQRRHKKAIVEIFSTKPKFVAGCLKRWFVKKIKVVYVEIDFQTKKLY